MRTPADPIDGTPFPGTGTVLRVVREGAPWPGTIVRHGDGRSALHVDVALLEGTAVWRATPDGHILAPIEIVRTPSGQDAVFELCAGRLDHVLGARTDAGAPPSAGECVTVAVSVLRGAHEAGATAGSWWVAEDGRPVLALGGATGVVDTSRQILRLLAGAAQHPLIDALRGAEAALSQLSADALADAEDALFSAADAAPLALSVPAPARAVSVSATARSDPGAVAGVRAAVERHVDGEVAERIAHASGDVRDRWVRLQERRAQRRGSVRVPRPTPAAKSRAQPSEGAGAVGAAVPVRRTRMPKPLFVGGGVAVAVVAAGLLWPVAEEPSERALSTPTPAMSAAPSVTDAPPSPAPAPAAGPAPEPVPPEDPAATADALLVAAAACGDESCVDALRESPGRPAIDGVLTLPQADRQVTLVDDYGGVAVVRVSAEGVGPDRLLVIVEAGHTWLIRDAYDVADQL